MGTRERFSRTGLNGDRFNVPPSQAPGRLVGGLSSTHRISRDVVNAFHGLDSLGRVSIPLNHFMCFPNLFSLVEAFSWMRIPDTFSKFANAHSVCWTWLFFLSKASLSLRRRFRAPW